MVVLTSSVCLTFSFSVPRETAAFSMKVSGDCSRITESSANAMAAASSPPLSRSALSLAASHVAASAIICIRPMGTYPQRIIDAQPADSLPARALATLSTASGTWPNRSAMNGDCARMSFQMLFGPSQDFDRSLAVPFRVCRRPSTAPVWNRPVTCRIAVPALYVSTAAVRFWRMNAPIDSSTDFAPNSPAATSFSHRSSAFRYSRFPVAVTASLNRLPCSTLWT